MLMQELRKIEARKKERERKTQDLQKLISGDSAFAEARKHDRRPFQRRKVQNPLKNRPPSNVSCCKIIVTFMFVIIAWW